MRDLSELLWGGSRGRHILIGGDLADRGQSLRLRSYKLIRRENDRFQFFNLELDPEEKNDLFELEAKRAAVYVRKLQTWRDLCAERINYAVAHPAGLE